MGDDRQENLQRALNEHRKRQLEHRFGGHFSPSGDDLPPELESRWLDSIEAFEEHLPESTPVRVRSLLDNPSLPPLEEVPAADLPTLLSLFFDLLEDHGVTLFFGTPMTRREQYAYIVGTFLDNDLEMIPDERWHYLYLYEMFEPEDHHDPTRVADMFVREILGGDAQSLDDLVVERTFATPQGPMTLVDSLLPRIRAWRGSSEVSEQWTLTFGGVKIAGETATIEVSAEWEVGLTTPPEVRRGTATIVLQKEQNGTYRVADFHF